MTLSLLSIDSFVVVCLLACLMKSSIFIPSSFSFSFTIILLESGEMAQLVKNLPGKHEFPSWTLRYHQTRWVDCNPNTEEVLTGGLLAQCGEL